MQLAIIVSSTMYSNGLEDEEKRHGLRRFVGRERRVTHFHSITSLARFRNQFVLEKMNNDRSVDELICLA